MKIIRFYPISILATIGVLYLSFAPPSTFEFAEPVSRFPHADKAIHFIMFFVLTLALIFEFFKRNKKTGLLSRKFWIICIVFPIALGGLIEILQGLFFYPRAAEWLDWLADIAGVVVAFFVYLMFKRRGKWHLP